jgi:hypothetical protein
MRHSLLGGGVALVAIVSMLALPMLACKAAESEPSMRTRPDANSIGIWKAYVPHGVKGELDNYDPIGLIAGALIKADCSINWRDPDSGKLYCFASGTSLVYFQDWPKANIRKATEALDKLTRPKAGS